MARNFFYGLEADNDEIDVGMNDLEKDSQDLIEDAGKDSETVDVSNISEAEAAHNEVASAGGVVVSKDNADDLTMDPVAATEAIIRRGFGLSTEDLDDVAEELAAAPVPEVEGEAPAADDELASITTVNVIPPAGGATEIAGPADVEPAGDVVPEVETAAAVAGVEFLNRLYSREDEDVDADVEFDVKTPSNDVNFSMQDKSITIEPNADGEDATMDTGDTGAEAGAEEPGEETGAEEPAGDEGAEAGAEEPGEEPVIAEEPIVEEPGEGEGEASPEAGEESWFFFN